MRNEVKAPVFPYALCQCGPHLPLVRELPLTHFPPSQTIFPTSSGPAGTRKKVPGFATSKYQSPGLPTKSLNFSTTTAYWWVQWPAPLGHMLAWLPFKKKVATFPRPITSILSVVAKRPTRNPINSILSVFAKRATGNLRTSPTSTIHCLFGSAPPDPLLVPFTNDNRPSKTVNHTSDSIARPKI